VTRIWQWGQFLLKETQKGILKNDETDEGSAKMSGNFLLLIMNKF
jgi:hypothetical protein